MDVAASLRQAADDLAALPPGRSWARRWTDEVDRALHELLPEVRGRFAVAATGGYGRRELCPGSDIDLLLLHDRVDDLEAAVRAITYPLWDAGLEVGHAVRTVREAAASDDIETVTATLDIRHVAGDPELVRQVRADLHAAVRRRSARFLHSLADADRERRARRGDAAEVLEPDLKAGAGGLRDVQSMRWAAAAALGESTLDALVTGQYLAAADRPRLAHAEDLLLAVRVALHLETGRKDDLLTMDRQDAVADRLGYDGGAALLHDLFLAARTIEHVHRHAWRLLLGDAGRWRLRRPADERLDGGFVVSAGVLRVEDDASIDAPDLPFRLLDALATTGAALDRRSAGRIARTSAGWSWTDTARASFTRTLWRGNALEALAEIDDLGLLVALLPEWEPVRGRPQRNPYHRYSLDRHAFHAVDELAALVRHEPWAAETLEHVEDREALLLGVFLHDVGKAYGEPHSETGVDVARSIATRMGCAPATVGRIAGYVRHHLLLPEVATRRDLADPQLASDVAATVRDPEVLAGLHLLAAADGRATGPAAWSTWKENLVGELVSRVRAVLEDEAGDAAAAAAREAQQIAPDLGVPPDVVRDHLAGLDPRYAASVSPRAIVRHASAAADPFEPTEVRTRVTPGDDVDDLDVLALDRPGLFAKVAGVLALHGGSILSAQAATRVDGVAVDTFSVVRPEGAAGSWWAQVEGDLVEAVAGRLALRARVARKAASQRRPRRTLPEVETTVTVERAGDATVVEVHAEDALGVLYRVAAGLAELELDIVAARIDTIGHEAVDVFYVRDATGAVLDDDHAQEVVLAVRTALDE